MERFGVSRPTLREAIRVLEMESLLRMRRGSHGGALVTAPDPQVAARAVGVLLQLRGVSLRDIHEARTMIEPMAARRIAESKDARQVLEILMSATRPRANVSDFREFPHRSWLFHKGLVEGTRNETLTVLRRRSLTSSSCSWRAGTAGRCSPARPKSRYGRILGRCAPMRSF